MLGEQIGEETGQITGTRVLPDEGAGPKVEVSFQASGTLLGAHESNMGTYVSVTRPDGTLFGEGQGVIRSTTWPGKGRWRAPDLVKGTSLRAGSTASGMATGPTSQPARASSTYQLRGITPACRRVHD